MMDFEELLRKIVARPRLNARFANTLSLLEYVGTRKILKSQRQDAITVELLAHIAEEIRHAQLLKRLALRLSDGELATYDEPHLLQGREASRYFQTVDHAAARVGLQRGLPHDPEDAWRTYLYTTLLIEERASRAYPPYERLLDPLGHGAVIRAILADERHHLADVLGHLGALDSQGLDHLRDIEASAFSEWMVAVEGEILK